jgi:hypothetical protein
VFAEITKAPVPIIALASKAAPTTTNGNFCATLSLGKIRMTWFPSTSAHPESAKGNINKYD